MTNYILTSWSEIGSYDKVLEDMENKIETITNTKTIILAKILPRGNDFVAVLLYET